MRYYYHPESSCLFTSEQNEVDKGDGLVEELTCEEYCRIQRQQKRTKTMQMAGSFDASQFAPRQAGDAHPPGKFPATISNTEIVPTKNQDGGMFVVTFTTPVGSIANRYNLWNNNPKAVEISHGELSALCHATGVFKLDWQNEGAALRNARCMIEVAPQLDKERKETGFMEIKKIFDPNGVEPGKAPPAAPQPQQQANPNPPMTQQPSGGWGNGPAAGQAGGGWGANQQPQQQQPNNQAPAGGWQQNQAPSNSSAPPWANR